MSDIIISKGGEGETFDLYAESSSDSSIQISRSKSKSKSKSRKPHRSYSPEYSPQSHVHKPQQEHRPRSSQPPMPDDVIGTFANPEKRRIEREEEAGSEAYSQNGDESVNESQDGYEEYEEEYQEDVPSDGFETIEDEKQDLLYKFYRMTTKGIPVNKKYNVNSDIHEMRREYNRINRDMEVNSSIKFSRRMLMACVTGIEFMNKRYDPFDVKLEGWSESVMENVDDYDNVFERLHDKYKSKVQMAPEIELLLSITGSAFMFHLTQSMFSNLPNLNDIAKSNPDIIQNLMKTMSQVNTSNTKPSNEAPNVDENGQREMKPPSFDISSVMSMFNPGGFGGPPVISQPSHQSPLPPPILKTHTPINNDTFKTPPTPVPSRTSDIPIMNRPASPSISQVSSSVNEDSIQSTDVLKQISFSESVTTNGGKRGRKRKPTNPEKTINI
jgi:hypothetical protein